MLTINQVMKLYLDGFNIKFKRTPSPAGNKGDYDPSVLEARVYLPAIVSMEDRDLTILHEIIHARDEIRSARSQRTNERKVESEARMTYYRKPYVLAFLKQLYKIR